MNIELNGVIFDIDITVEQYGRIMAGAEHVQNIAPGIPPCERDIFIVRITPKEWEETFGGCFVSDECSYFKRYQSCKYNVKIMEEEEDEDESETIQEHQE